MSDRELLEKIISRLDKMDARIERMDRGISAFMTNTEINFERIFNEIRLLQQKSDNVIAMVKLLDEDYRHFRIDTKDRLDRLEREKI